MQFTIARGALRSELELLGNVIKGSSKDSSKEYPALSCVRIATIPTGVELTGTNGEITLKTALAVGTEGEGEVLVDGKHLTDIVKALEGDSILIRHDEGQRLQLECGPSQFQIPSTSALFPVLPSSSDDDPEFTSINAKLLADMITRVVFAINIKEHRIPPGALLVVGEETGTMLSATDGLRLALVRGKGENVGFGADLRVLIPAKSLEVVAALGNRAGGEAHIWATKNHIFFRFSNRLLISTQVTGEYPNVSAAIGRYSKGKNTAIMNRQKLTQSLKRALLVSNDAVVKLEFAASIPELRFNAAHSLLGEANEAMSISYAGDSFTTYLDVNLVLQFLTSAGTDDVTLTSGEQKDPILFGSYGEAFSHEYLMAQVYRHPETIAEQEATQVEPSPKAKRAKKTKA